MLEGGGTSHVLVCSVFEGVERVMCLCLQCLMGWSESCICVFSV